MGAASDVRDDLLGLMSLESIAHAPTGAATRMLRDLNGSLQQIFSTAPDSFWGEKPWAEIIRAPTTVAITVNANSKAVTFAAWVAWMNGCTIVIPGDGAQNQIVASSSASVALVKPFTGSTGTVNAVVYNDLIHPGTDVEQVMAPVMLEDFWELVPLAHERDRQVSEGQGGSLYPLAFSNRAVQPPRHYLIERAGIYNGASTPAIRLSTLPDRAGRLSFRVKITAPVVTSFDDARTWLVPHSYHESILLPLVRYKFSSWPHFTGDRSALKEDYDAALLQIANLRPRGMRETHITVGGDW